MPLKKTGKGKGKGKGKKGKGKGKKKGSKKEKPEKDQVMKEALSNAALWEARYQASEKSRAEYRENARRLVGQNEGLQATVHQTEQDTIEVIAFLKKEDSRKDEELGQFRRQVKDVRQEGRREKEALEEQHSQEVVSLQSKLEERGEEVRVMQGELKTIREFRKRRGEMQRQLEQLQASLESSEKEHRTTLSEMEQRLFEEKIRVQKEANRRIADLAEKAHSEAVSNLDDRTREVYRENVRMAEALGLHMEREEGLQRERNRLEMANRQLVAEKELHQQLVQEKIAQARHHRRVIKELQEKVGGLEEALGVVVREFEEEKRLTENTHTQEIQAASSELQSLRRRCDLQGRELNHVKRLARRILDQRTETETFFLEALSHVRREVAANRAQYRRDAQLLYQQRVLEATRGRGGFPPVRTFRALDTSTNSVYHDMDQAARWDGMGEQADISDLTWEQKEQVLRLLFAKMNQTSHPSPPLPLPPPHHSLPSIEGTHKEEETEHRGELPAVDPPTFLTQQHSTAQPVSGQVT